MNNDALRIIVLLLRPIPSAAKNYCLHPTMQIAGLSPINQPWSRRAVAEGLSGRESPDPRDRCQPIVT